MEVLEQEVAEKGKILIRAYNPKFQLPVKVSPCEDITGRLYTGQGSDGYFESLSDEEKRKMSYVVTRETVVTLSDGKVIDLDNNEVDRINWKWIRKHPYLALDKSIASHNRDVVYYVENPVAEAKQRLSKTKDIDEARYQIRNLSLDKQKRAAKTLGLVTADSFSEEQLTDWLLETANNSPKAVLQAINPLNAERNGAKVFFNELMKYKVLERETNGNYKVQGENGLVIAHDVELVLDWMLDGKNGEMVRILKTRLEEVKNGK